jgi:hypothetical protein
MNIITVREGRRGCGFRKPGGLYLRTDGFGRHCGALPISLHVCPTCHQGIKPARGWTWINLAALASVRGCVQEGGCGDCPIADASIQTCGLLWVGQKFYPNTAVFTQEANTMGLSRRIIQIPKAFKLGTTWVALAHRHAIADLPDDKPGIFHVFKPTRIEYVVRRGDSETKLEKLERRGITLVKVEPIDDEDLL